MLELGEQTRHSVGSQRQCLCVHFASVVAQVLGCMNVAADVVSRLEEPRTAHTLAAQVSAARRVPLVRATFAVCCVTNGQTRAVVRCR